MDSCYEIKCFLIWILCFLTVVSCQYSEKDADNRSKKNVFYTWKILNSYDCDSQTLAITWWIDSYLANLGKLVSLLLSMSLVPCTIHFSLWLRSAGGLDVIGIKSTNRLVRKDQPQERFPWHCGLSSMFKRKGSTKLCKGNSDNTVYIRERNFDENMFYRLCRKLCVSMKFPYAMTGQYWLIGYHTSVSFRYLFQFTLYVVNCKGFFDLNKIQWQQQKTQLGVKVAKLEGKSYFFAMAD